MNCEAPINKGVIMPIKLEYDQNKKILIVAVIGQVTLQEIASALEKIVSSGEYPLNVDALWDLRQADFKSADANLLRSIVELREQHPERANFRLALIAPDDLSYGMMRMYEMLSEWKLSRNLMVFRNYAAGEQWILQNRTA
jgi:hypothetical protein